MGQFKKNSPGCNCCGIACPRCSGSSPSIIPVTLGGFGDSGECSDCSGLDATFNLSAVNVCLWQWSGSIVCGGGTITVTGLQASIAPRPFPPANMLWTVSLFMNKGANSQSVFWEWDSGDTVAVDCTATRTLTLQSSTCPSGTCICFPYAGATCQIN